MADGFFLWSSSYSDVVLSWCCRWCLFISSFCFFYFIICAAALCSLLKSLYSQMSLQLFSFFFRSSLDAPSCVLCWKFDRTEKETQCIIDESLELNKTFCEGSASCWRCWPPRLPWIPGTSKTMPSWSDDYHQRSFLLNRCWVQTNWLVRND